MGLPLCSKAWFESHEKTSMMSGSSPRERILVRGFGDVYEGEDNPDGKLRWYCAPADCKPSDGNTTGSWHVDNLQQLEIVPPAGKDFWQKTFYDPVLVKDNGSFLYHELDADRHYTVETSFTLTAASQFDQAGLMLRIGPSHWLKAGIEVVDRQPRLSCVITNDYSDWSTQMWLDSRELEGKVVVAARLRLHCRGQSFVVESKHRYKEWELVRIAHLNNDLVHTNDPLAEDPTTHSAWRGPAAPPGKFWVGVYACCPQAQKGCHVSFSHIQITEGSQFDHNAHAE